MNKADKNLPLEDILSKKTGIPNLVEVLGKTPLYKITPVQIKAAKERAEDISPQDLLKNYDSKSDFFGVSFLSQEEILKFKLAFYSVMPDFFESVEISPIAPLGTNSVVTNVSQDKVMSTTRGSEVVGDPTTSLILECASRRKEFAKREVSLYKRVNLATFHRVLRMQSFDKTKGYMQQFNLLGMATAGRDKDYHQFVFKVFQDHISTLLDFVEYLNTQNYTFKDLTVKISNTQLLEVIISSLSISREEITENSNNETFDFFDYFGIEIPKELSSINQIEKHLIEKYNLGNVLSRLGQFEESVFEYFNSKYPNVKFLFNFNRVAGVGYYRDFCFHIFATNKDGRKVQLSDGGSVNYVGKLLSDKKEYAVTSGIGAELVQKLFKDFN